MTEALLLVIFVIGYVFITAEHAMIVNKGATALLMAVLSWTVLFMQGSRHYPYHIVPPHIVEQLNIHLHEVAQVFIFLLGAMTIVALIDAHRGFYVMERFIRAQGKRKFLWMISLATFFLSSVLDNVTTAIIMTSMVHRLVPDREGRMIFLSIVIIAANAGGAWSPIGDVTTTMLWIGGQVSAKSLMATLFFPSMVSLLVPTLYFTVQLRGEIPPAPSQEEDRPPERGAKRVLILGIGGLIFVPIVRELTGLPPFMGMMLILGMVWAFTDLLNQQRHYLRVPHILTKVDMSSVLFFLGILLTVSALETKGVLAHMALWMDTHLGDKDRVITFMGLASAVIDNVPLTAASIGMYPLTSYPMDARMWHMIAYCVGTGGSILIIGSAAGVVVMGMERMSFLWYLRRVSLPALIGYFSGVGVLFVIFRFIL
jgi:Na+/H+ antiporter NhaD/arsenite permease-like protein